MAISEIADRLGTSRDAVRYALRRYPAPELCLSASRSGLSKRCLASPRCCQQTPYPNFMRNRRLSLREIAERYGVERKVVARLARQYGVALRLPQRPRRHEEIDRDWLYTEYVVRRRALPDLAAEKGMSTMNMSR